MRNDLSLPIREKVTPQKVVMKQEKARKHRTLLLKYGTNYVIHCHNATSSYAPTTSVRTEHGLKISVHGSDAIDRTINALALLGYGGSTCAVQSAFGDGVRTIPTTITTGDHGYVQIANEETNRVWRIRWVEGALEIADATNKFSRFVPITVDELRALVKGD